MPCAGEETLIACGCRVEERLLAPISASSPPNELTEHAARQSSGACFPMTQYVKLYNGPQGKSVSLHIHAHERGRPARSTGRGYGLVHKAFAWFGDNSQWWLGEVLRSLVRHEPGALTATVQFREADLRRVVLGTPAIELQSRVGLVPCPGVVLCNAALQAVDVEVVVFELGTVSVSVVSGRGAKRTVHGPGHLVATPDEYSMAHPSALWTMGAHWDVSLQFIAAEVAPETSEARVMMAARYMTDAMGEKE